MEFIMLEYTTAWWLMQHTEQSPLKEGFRVQLTYPHVRQNALLTDERSKKRVEVTPCLECCSLSPVNCQPGLFSEWELTERK